MIKQKKINVDNKVVNDKMTQNKAPTTFRECQGSSDLPRQYKKLTQYNSKYSKKTKKNG